ncbi:hypothetical protein JXJ21_02770 [candidate division KSB1 bacterium]|nr:hypothetical protein [candidate division KSB1 bacterium]
MRRSNLSRFIRGLIRLGTPGKKRLAMTIFRVFGHALNDREGEPERA